jgi:hypothetical protein
MMNPPRPRAKDGLDADERRVRGETLQKLHANSEAYLVEYSRLNTAGNSETC